MSFFESLSHPGRSALGVADCRPFRHTVCFNASLQDLQAAPDWLARQVSSVICPGPCCPRGCVPRQKMHCVSTVGDTASLGRWDPVGGGGSCVQAPSAPRFNPFPALAHPNDVLCSAPVTLSSVSYLRHTVRLSPSSPSVVKKTSERTPDCAVTFCGPRAR